VGTQAKWLAGVLVVALAAAGWFGWRQARWRQIFYVEITSQLIYDLDMAERDLVRARETGNYQEKVEAMATAHGFLVSAHMEAEALLKQIAPFRKGEPIYIARPAMALLIQYARNLSPDLPGAAVQKRIELLDGLGKALAAAIPGGEGKPGYAFAMDPLQYRVDVPALKQSLADYFETMVKPDDYTRMPRFEDEPNQPEISASREGNDVVIRVDWTQTFKTFPHDRADIWVLVRPRTAGSAVTATSDAGKQQRMVSGAFEPVEAVTLTADQHEAWKDRLPPGWSAGSYTVIRLPEGLPQTVTLRGAGGGEVYLLNPRLGEKAQELLVGVRTLNN
jgi:hypothetical protein